MLRSLIGTATTVALALALFGHVSGAHATVMTVTWSGTIYASDFDGAGASIGDTMQTVFTYDTGALGIASGSDNHWSNYLGPSSGENGFFTSATYTAGSLSGSVVGNAAYPTSFTYFSNGFAPGFLETFARDFSAGDKYIDSYSYGGSTQLLSNGDPTQTFIATDLTNAYMTVYLGPFYIRASANSVTVSAAETAGVPAPGALALLGLGLFGIGGLRRKQTA